MTDRNPQNERSNTASAGKRRKAPPLVWLVIGLLVIVVAIAARQWNGTYRTPTGGTAPMVANGHTVMPANPGQHGAPATPPSQS